LFQSPSTNCHDDIQNSGGSSNSYQVQQQRTFEVVTDLEVKASLSVFNNLKLPIKRTNNMKRIISNTTGVQFNSFINFKSKFIMGCTVATLCSMPALNSYIANLSA